MSKTEGIATSPEGKDNLCDPSGSKCAPCSVRDRQCSVFSFCINCYEHLCEDCSEYHRKLKLTRGHTLLEGVDIPSDVSIFKDMARLTMCKLHEDREVEFKCNTHNVFICSLCIVDRHRSCNRVEPIKDCRCFRDDFKKYIGLKSSIEESRELCLTRLHDRETCKIDEQISESVTDLNKLATFLDKDLRNSVNRKKKQESDDLSAYMSKLESCLNRMNVSGTLVDTTLKYGNGYQLTVLANDINARITDMEQTEEMRKNREPELVSKFLNEVVGTLDKLREEIKLAKEHILNLPAMDADDFAFDHALASKDKAQVSTHEEAGGESGMLEAFNTKKDRMAERQDNSNDEEDLKSHFDELQASSDIEITKQSSLTMQLSPAERTDVDISSETVFVSLLESTVQVNNEIDISIEGHSSDYICNHTGSLVFQNGNMIFMDSANNTIKLIDMNFTVRAFYHLNAEPDDMSLIDDNLVAVLEDADIVFYTVYHTDIFQIVRGKTFKTKRLPCSLMHAAGELALLYCDEDDDNDETFIQLRTLDNRILDSVDEFCDLRSKTIDLCSPSQIRARNADEFIIAEEDRISAFDRSGDMEWYYHRHLESADYVAFDTEGNIYVCDNESGTVHQISSNSYKISRILISNLVNPSSVLYNPVNRMLVIGCKEDNFVHTYRFT